MVCSVKPVAGEVEQQECEQELLPSLPDYGSIHEAKGHVGSEPGNECDAQTKEYEPVDHIDDGVTGHNPARTIPRQDSA